MLTNFKNVDYVSWTIIYFFLDLIMYVTRTKQSALKNGQTTCIKIGYKLLFSCQ